MRNRMKMKHEFRTSFRHDDIAKETVAPTSLEQAGYGSRIGPQPQDLELRITVIRRKLSDYFLQAEQLLREQGGALTTTQYENILAEQTSVLERIADQIERLENGYQRSSNEETVWGEFEDVTESIASDDLFEDEFVGPDSYDLYRFA